jgi:type II secretory pathway component PulF
MPAFEYIGVDTAGRPRAGRIDAPTLEEAQSRLTAEGLSELRLLPAGGAVSAGPAAEVGSARETPALAAALSEVTAVGLPLGAGLQALAAEASSPRVRRTLREVSRCVESGMPLDEALAAADGELPAVLGGVIRAGLRGGRLPEALARYIDLDREAREQRHALRLAVAYPLLLVLLSAAIVVGLFWFIVPEFDGLMTDFGIELPWATEVLLETSRGLRRFGPWFLAAALVAGLAAYALLRLWAPGDLRAEWLNSVPVYGHWRRNFSLARFCRLLVLLLEGETPLPEAIRLAAAGADPGLARSGRRLAERVEAGLPPAEAVPEAAGFPRLLAVVFRWQDRGPAFREGLEALADFFTARSRSQLNLLTLIFEPLIILGIGLTIGFVVLSLFLPLMKLLNELS